MSAKARLGPVTDLLNRHVRVYFIETVPGQTTEQVWSFESVDKVAVDQATVLPEQIKPLVLTQAEAQSLYEELGKRLTPAPVGEVDWKAMYLEERSVVRTLHGLLAAREPT